MALLHPASSGVRRCEQHQGRWGCKQLHKCGLIPAGADLQVRTHTCNLLNAAAVGQHTASTVIWCLALRAQL
jgi:hypothetical protein